MKLNVLLSLAIFIIFTNGVMAQEMDNSFALLEPYDKTYTKAVLNNKPDLLSSYQSDEIRLMPEYQKTIKGKENVKMYWKALAGRFEILQYSRTITETIDMGAQRVVFGQFAMQAKLKSSGKTYDMPGTYMNIWKKDENGQWKVITEAWVYRQWVECAHDLVFNEVPTSFVAFEPRVVVNNSIRFELAAINAYTERFISEHDAQKWLLLYDDQGRLIYSHHPIFSGKEAIKAFLEDHVKELPVFEKLDIRTDQIDPLDEYVIEYSSHIAITRNGDWSGVNTGKNVVIWKRQPDCSLKVYRSIAMYDF